MINDYRGIGSGANCAFSRVWLRGMPSLCVVVLSPVALGDEFLLDYGPLYWQRAHLRHEARPGTGDGWGNAYSSCRDTRYDACSTGSRGDGAGRGMEVDGERCGSSCDGKVEGGVGVGAGSVVAVDQELLRLEEELMEMAMQALE